MYRHEHISMRLQRNSTTQLVQPNQNSQNKNECSYGLVSITQKYQTPSSSMAVTSCHYTALISPAPPAGVDKHMAISSKFRGKNCITNSLY
jgi:hypothetical protein